MKHFFSIFFSIAIFFNSVFFTLMLWVGLLWMKKRKGEKDYVHWVAGRWARNSVRLIFTPVKISGLENLDSSKSYIIVSNHASNFDIFMLLGYLPLNSIFISKKANFKIPFIGSAMRMMGCIPIHRNHARSALASMEEAVRSYLDGNSIIIFPEGTRSITGTPTPFKAGFLHLAKHNPIRILPITLSGTYRIQPKGSWIISPSRIKMVVSKPLVVTPEQVDNPIKRQRVLEELENTIHSQFIKDYY